MYQDLWTQAKVLFGEILIVFIYLLEKKKDKINVLPKGESNFLAEQPDTFITHSSCLTAVQPSYNNNSSSSHNNNSNSNATALSKFTIVCWVTFIDSYSWPHATQGQQIDHAKFSS